MSRYNKDRELSIASLGRLNVKTGSSKYFNVYETWANATAEIHRTSKDTTVIIFTQGDKPICEVGVARSFKSDQSWRHLFDAYMVESCPIADLSKVAAKYGNSFTAYTYK